MRANYKVPKRIKGKIITELYTYWKNKKELEEIDMDIIDSTPERDITGISAKYKISNPTELKALKLANSLSTRAYIVAVRRISYVESAMKRLTKEDKEVVELIFRDGFSQPKAEIEKNISYSNYYNVFNKIIYYTAIEFGEI